MSVSPLKPIEVPWEMKSVDSAELQLDELDDGRLRFGIRHEIIEGVSPAMIVWFLNHMDADIEIGGVTMSRYRAWHPRDHVAVTYLRPAKAGQNVGPGSKLRIREFFGGKPEFRVDIVDEVDRLDEGGFVHVHRPFGIELARMEYTFTPTDRGTLYENCLIIGRPKAFLSAAFNRLIRPRVFSREQGIAWQKHNVEEVGNWQFFLPRLFADNA